MSTTPEEKASSSAPAKQAEQLTGDGFIIGGDTPSAGKSIEPDKHQSSENVSTTPPSEEKGSEAAVAGGKHAGGDKNCLSPPASLKKAKVSTIVWDLLWKEFKEVLFDYLFLLGVAAYFVGLGAFFAALFILVTSVFSSVGDWLNGQGRPGYDPFRVPIWIALPVVIGGIFLFLIGLLISLWDSWFGKKSTPKEEKQNEKTDQPIGEAGFASTTKELQPGYAEEPTNDEKVNAGKAKAPPAKMTRWRWLLASMSFCLCALMLIALCLVFVRDFAYLLWDNTVFWIWDVCIMGLFHVLHVVMRLPTWLSVVLMLIIPRTLRPLRSPSRGEGDKKNQEGDQQGFPLPTETYTHAPSRFSFPPKVGGFVRVGGKQFDGEGLDVGVYYELDQTVALDVFVSPIPQAGSDSNLEGYFESCKRYVLSHQQDAELISESPMTVSPGGQKRAGKHATFTFTLPLPQEQQAARLELYLFTFGPWFIEYQSNYHVSQQAMATPVIKAFMEELRWPEEDKS